MMQAGVHIRVSGVVQGVGFRYFVAEIARNLNLTGYVRNLPDGNVEIYAEGDRSHLEELISKSKAGPRFARVTGLDLEWKTMEFKHPNFTIR